MLQELTAETGAGLWATGSLLFFIAVYLFVSIRLFREKPDVLDACARLALDDGEPRATGTRELDAR